MKKLSIALAGLALAAVTLTGCSALLPQQKPQEKPKATQSEEAPAETTDAKAPVSGDGFADGVDAAPGSTVAAGTWGNIPYVDFDDLESVLAHRLVGVEKASTADVDALIAEIPEIKGMDVYYVRAETRYVSGELQSFVSPGSEFRVIDANGSRAQSLILIGWDACKSNAFGSDDEMHSQVIENCFAAVAAPGGNAPAGLQWSQYDTPTADSPISFFYNK